MKQALVDRIIKRDKGCLAPRLDPQESGKCWGRWTLEHVNDEPTRGKRAPSDEQHMVCLCERHAGLNLKAGEQWNTKRENRYKLRRYLWRTYDLLCDWHECEQRGSMTLLGRQLCQPHYDLLSEGVFI